MKGSCLCGAVGFEATGALRDPGACHCGQCRKQSGHYWASVGAAQADVTISGPVKWYAASAVADRGFCPECGAFLFWKPRDGGDIGLALGAVDGPSGVRLEKHIFVAFKGDYYDIADGLPQEGRENG